MTRLRRLPTSGGSLSKLLVIMSFMKKGLCKGLKLKWVLGAGFEGVKSLRRLLINKKKVVFHAEGLWE